MSGINKIDDLLFSLQQNPLEFLKTNQSESMTLEYKASFVLDTAMLLCPLITDKKKSLNHLLSLRILETIVAFANTYGGILVMGIAEEKGQIIEEREKKACLKKNELLNGNERCYEMLFHQKGFMVGDLKVTGIENELEILNADFDKFKRRFLDRFTLSQGQKSLSFKSTVYPCMDLADKLAPVVNIMMSENIDQCIGEIVPVSVIDGGNQFTLGIVVIKPSSSPIYLTINKSNSKNILYALPVRKTGKTELEKDLSRVQTYISERFGLSLAEKIAEKLNELKKNNIKKTNEPVTKDNVQSVVAKYAKEWGETGCPYHMIEDYGKKIKSFTADMSIWSIEDNKEKLAFLLMVSLHFNNGWEKWTLRNKNNEFAVKGLFETFHINYWRTRFRALYALQFLDQSLVKNELGKKRHQIITEKTRHIIETSVPDKKVVAVIKEISESQMGDISKKAKSVIIEIATLWNDPDTGLESPL